MMRLKVILLLLLVKGTLLFAQKDSLSLGDKYWEDQLYLNVSYNVLLDQPSTLPGSSFSYGLGFGYIKDIPLNKQGAYAFGAGLGYGYDSFNHRLLVTKNGSEITFGDALSSNSNTLRLHNLELPLQFRWRTSNAVTYSFWRVYAGVTIRYNIYNGFTNGNTRVTNIDNFNKWFTDLTLSAGYGTFNLYISYGLQSMLNNAQLNGEQINSKILRVGLSFYLL